METLQVIASKREERNYTEARVDGSTAATILDAGRVAGSAKNEQPCRMTMLATESKAQVAEVVTRPTNVLGAQLLVLITARSAGRRTEFDAGRAAQNMMLAAWDLGVGSCPNTVRDGERLRRLIDVPEDEDIVTILSFGYPTRYRDPRSRSFEQWIDAAERAPRDEVVR